MKPHQMIVRGMRQAQMLPAPGDGIDETERRQIRNKLKAQRKKHRR